MIEPRDIVAIFEDCPESGGTIGHYGTVVSIGANSFTDTQDRIIRVLVCGREVDLFERDVLATGRVDDSNPWNNSSCTVSFDPLHDYSEQRGSYRSRAGSFNFVFRVSELRVPTYNLWFPPGSDSTRIGELIYDTPSGTTLTREFVLRAIGKITGELAVPDRSGPEQSDRTRR